MEDALKKDIENINNQNKELNTSKYSSDLFSK